MLIISQLFL